MRVLYINDFREKGGAENYIAEIRDNLEAENHETKLLSLKDSEKFVFSDFTPLNYARRYFSPINRFKIEREIHKFDPDVIHLNNIYFGTIPVLRAVGNSRVPSVITFHDFTYFCECGGLHGKGLCSGRVEECLKREEISLFRYIWRKPINVLKKKYLRVVEEAIAPSKDLKTVSQNWVDTKHLPNPVKTDEFEPQLDDKEKKDILFVGRLVEEKGLDILIEALDKFETDRNLKVVGKGNREKYESLVQEKGLNDSVEFKGFVSDEKLKKLYRESEITVIPSKWRENSPLVLLESMASGTPVIGANIGGIPDYILDGENGYLFDFRSSSSLREKLKLFTSREDKQEMNKKARETAEKYSENQHVNELKEIYRSLR